MPSLGLKLPQVAACRRRVRGPVVPDLPIWRAARAAVAAGERNARILCIGNSTTAGHGAYAAGMGDNNKAGAWPTQLAALINARGGVASWSSIIGNNNAADSRLYDSRVTFPALQGWAFSTASGVNGSTLGGYHTMVSGYNPPSKYNFAPLNACDTFEVYNPKAGGNARAWILSVNDGADLATISNLQTPSPPGEFEKYTLTTELGANALNIRAQNIETTYLAGIIAYNSAIKEISVLNAGWSGAKASDLNNGSPYAYGPVNAISVYDPDLVIINIGINDANQASPTATATFSSHVQAVITAAKAAGADVVLMAPTPIGSSYAANLNTLSAAVVALGITNGVPVIDLRTRFTDYTTANAAGWMRDTLHPNASGYAQIATAVADLIFPG
ncbi:SGNH/GDSL hydrolase family protein [Asticcacaulis sp. ZE23SCel15]|uniref:SGNH/GDSL hydrolase family protein n=1 Tax=Asticcacaulis sp. ZE23SCel15 TaxID=3059027 RepID=UPI00265DA560|nr:SGNH/GDSL hydrolase family protein [Asticcacaulis sp. ZE23SCel15]WKL57986.1 SGNH/GDSL hydrolase family protein [Asticcacaulis sp. ZE23SCel15]